MIINKTKTISLFIFVAIAALSLPIITKNRVFAFTSESGTKKENSSTRSGSYSNLPGESLSVPLCSDHDDSKWHPLVIRNSDGSVNCSYGHEHHDDPNLLNDVFGPVGQYTGGREISYPWQTSSTMGTENHSKHPSYKWNVVSVSTCKPSNTPYGFKNVRALFHQDGVLGATARFHSYWLEAEGCDPSDPNFSGIIKVGGHLDYGFLRVSNTGNSTITIPLPDSPTRGDDRRLHMGYIDESVPCCRNGDFTWYGSNRPVRYRGVPKITVRNGLRGEDWGAIDPANPYEIVFNPTMWHGPTFKGNNSWQEPVHLLSIRIPVELDASDGSTDGKVTYEGFVDRHGNIQSSDCSTAGVDCVPVYIEGMKVGNYQFRADANGVKQREYDVIVNGKSLIQYPN